MKKYFMSAIVIVMAIGMNSFTNLSAKSATDPKPTVLFWYKVNSSNKVTQNLGHVDRTTLIPGTCPATGSTICARGYASDPSLQVGDTAPTSSTDDLKRP